MVKKIFEEEPIKKKVVIKRKPKKPALPPYVDNLVRGKDGKLREFGSNPYGKRMKARFIEKQKPKKIVIKRDPKKIVIKRDPKKIVIKRDPKKIVIKKGLTKTEKEDSIGLYNQLKSVLDSNNKKTSGINSFSKSNDTRAITDAKIQKNKMILKIKKKDGSEESKTYLLLPKKAPVKKVVIKREPKKADNKIVIKREPKKADKKVVIKREPKKADKKVVIKREPKEQLDEKKYPREKMIKKYNLKVGDKIQFTNRSGLIATITKLGDKTMSWKTDDEKTGFSNYRTLELDRNLGKGKAPAKKQQITKEDVLSDEALEEFVKIQNKDINKREKLEKEEGLIRLVVKIKKGHKNRKNLSIEELYNLEQDYKKLNKTPYIAPLKKEIKDIKNERDLKIEDLRAKNRKEAPTKEDVLKEDTNEFHLNKFERYLKSDNYKNDNIFGRRQQLGRIIEKLVYPSRYTTDGQADKRINDTLKIAYDKITKFRDSLKEPKREKTTEKELREMYGPKTYNPRRDLMKYLNDTSTVNFNGLMKNNKELSKKWFKKLKELVNEFLDSDIPYDVENINKELFKTKTLKEMRDILYREIDSDSRRDLNDELNDIFRFNSASGSRIGYRYTLFNRRQERASERNKTANIKAVGITKIKEIIRFNDMREEICDLIIKTSKKYGTKTGEEMKKLKEKKTKLQNQLKKELKNFENPLRFLGSMCSLDDLPKGLQKIVDDKLFNMDDKKLPFGGQMNELRSRAYKIFNVSPESLKSKDF